MHNPSLQINNKSIFSEALKREVRLTIITPVQVESNVPLKLLLVNDGQDFEALNLFKTLETLLNNQRIEPIAIVGIHAGHERLHEYGIASQSDYANRGSRAGETTLFVLNELLPYLKSAYHIKDTEVAYAGFSLGGLMALDMVWNYPDVFSAVGVFSGSLWWRQRSLDEGYNDLDRIMHNQIKSGEFSQNLKFWFECGTADETDDRDNDGVIDSIQDTLDCISELERKGYRWGKEIQYVEVDGGEHNPGTWGGIIPEFLEWAFLSK